MTGLVRDTFAILWKKWQVQVLMYTVHTALAGISIPFFGHFFRAATRHSAEIDGLWYDFDFMILGDFVLKHEKELIELLTLLVPLVGLRILLKILFLGGLVGELKNPQRGFRFKTFFGASRKLFFKNGLIWLICTFLGLIFSGVVLLFLILALSFSPANTEPEYFLSAAGPLAIGLALFAWLYCFYVMAVATLGNRCYLPVSEILAISLRFVQRRNVALSVFFLPPFFSLGLFWALLNLKPLLPDNLFWFSILSSILFQVVVFMQLALKNAVYCMASLLMKK